MAKSNEVLDKCIAYAEKDQWCSFGYLAALVDKKNRTEGMGYPAIRRYDRRPGCSRVVIHNGVPTSRAMSRRSRPPCASRPRACASATMSCSPSTA